METVFFQSSLTPIQPTARPHYSSTTLSPFDIFEFQMAHQLQQKELKSEKNISNLSQTDDPQHSCQDAIDEGILKEKYDLNQNFLGNRPSLIFNSSSNKKDSSLPRSNQKNNIRGLSPKNKLKRIFASKENHYTIQQPNKKLKKVIPKQQLEVASVKRNPRMHRSVLIPIRISCQMEELDSEQFFQYSETLKKNLYIVFLVVEVLVILTLMIPSSRV